MRDSHTDRRSFIKRGLMSGGSFALAGTRGPAAARAAGSRSGSLGASRRQPPEHPCDRGRSAAQPRAAAAHGGARVDHAEPRRVAPRLGQLRTPLHGLQRLHALAERARDGALHAPDALPDHGAQPALAGLPHMGQAAARNGLRNDLVGQVAPEPRRKRPPRPVRVLAAVPTRRRTEGPVRERKSTAGSSRSSRNGSPTRAGWNRGARRSRWSTRTTSPGGIASRKKCRSRARPRPM